MTRVTSPATPKNSPAVIVVTILPSARPSDDADAILDAFSSWKDIDDDDENNNDSLFCREDDEDGNFDGDWKDEDDRNYGQSGGTTAIPEEIRVGPDVVVTLVSHRLGVSIHLLPSSSLVSTNDDDEGEETGTLPMPSASSQRRQSVAVTTFPTHEAPVVRRVLQRFASKWQKRGDRSARLRVHPPLHVEGVQEDGCIPLEDDDASHQPMTMAELTLPSGSSLVLVPANLSTTRRGRYQLNQFLRGGDVTRTCTEANEVLHNSESISQRDTQVVPVSASPLPDPRVLFPTLQVQLLSGNSTNTNADSTQGMVPFPVNSSVGQDFETELFRGKLLVVMRPQIPELDKHWNDRMFAVRKRRILIQLQGKFRRTPRGTVFAGAEVSEPMKLGLLARGLSGVLLRIVEGFNPTVHYSFGTNNNQDDEEERAHIVVPAYSFFERFVVTPPGQVPPILGEEWDESKESRERRKNPREASQFQFNDRDTYSFSFYSMYMDLPTWQLVNLPIPKGDVSLKTFWRDSLLRICMYERSAGDGLDMDSTPLPKQHLVKYNKYAFLLQIQYSERKAEEQQLEEQVETLFRMSGSKYVESNGGERTIVVGTGGARKGTEDSLNRSESQLFPVDDETNVTTERDDDDDNYNHEDDMSRYLDAVQEHEDEWLLEQTPVEVSMDEGVQTSAVPALPPSSSSRPTSLDLLSRIDDHCPLFLDAIKNRLGYTRMYMVRVDARCTFRTLRECEELASDASRSGPVQRIVNPASSPRLSSSERLRRVVGCVLANPSACLPSREDKKRLDQFVKTRTSSEGGLFLRRSEPNLNDRERASLRWSGFVARALSDRHWMEEFATVTHRSVSFSHPDKRRANSRVMIRSIEKVTVLPPEACPPNVAAVYSFLEIETLGRSIYLMFANPQLRDAFSNEIMTLRSEAQDDDANSSLASNPLALDIENPADEFMHKSSLWNLKNRRLLNGGKFYFSSHATCNALELVATALRRASAVANDPYDEYEQRHSFLVSAAELKRAHVLHLPEEWRLVFFLNLYHLMILHAFIVLGPPDSTLQWISYFNNASYEIADDVFSLAELEHCIVRNEMSPPSQFLSRFVIPKSRYSVALHTRDCRINFALSCGSLSNPDRVSCFRVATLSEQLDGATRRYLESTTMTLRTAPMNGAAAAPTELVLFLPRVCQWFLPDFGDGVEAMLRRLEPYFKDPIRRALERFKMRGGRFDMTSITVRYYNYNFECRPFVVEDP